MKDTCKESDKKKGLLAAIWESMTKTGGCCGSGGNCCGPSPSEADEKKAEKEPAAPTSSRGGQSR